MELDAEGWVGPMGKVSLPGGQVLLRGDSLGGAKRDLGKSFPLGGRS